MSVPYARHFKQLKVEDLGGFVYNVILNRPKQLNAMTNGMWIEMRQAFEEIDKDPNCRVVIFSGNGKCFSSGIDLADLSAGFDEMRDVDVARGARKGRLFTLLLQESISSIEKCCKPVIASIHRYCLGAGIDITSACDLRFCTKDAQFSVKETHVGFAAEAGTLNRLPHIIGNHSWMRDICMSGRHFKGEEALKYGLVSRMYDTKEAMDKDALEFARDLASLSPVAVTGVKNVLNFARDHSVQDSLKFVELWNMSQAQTVDIAASAAAIMQKQKRPDFAKL